MRAVRAVVAPVLRVPFRRRAKRPLIVAPPSSPYAEAPAALAQAKGAFERANASLLAAEEARTLAAAEVLASGTEMTAIYHEWALRRAKTALEQNGGRRASVIDRIEHVDELLSRPQRPPSPSSSKTSVFGSRSVGVAEWFMVGEHERVERVVGELRELGVRQLRTAVSWADWFTDEAPAWYEWLLPLLARNFEVLPCLMYTPPSLGIVPSTASPPRWAPAYTEFVAQVLLRYEQLFEHIELWNEPNCLSEWDWTLDPDWSTFCEMVAPAAQIARRRGLRVVLGGMTPPDPAWLELMCERGLIGHVDAVGIHGFPGTWEADWKGWDTSIGELRQVLERHGSGAEIWITETGYSTWNDEQGQIAAFVEAARAPAERVYWFCAEDLKATRSTIDGFHNDEREYHLGLHREGGEPKLLAQMWAAGGLAGVEAASVSAGSDGHPPHALGRAAGSAPCHHSTHPPAT